MNSRTDTIEPDFAAGEAPASQASETVEIRPRRGWFDLDLLSIWRYRELLFFLVWRDVKVRYKQAALGVVWVVLQPAAAVLVFTAVFGVFVRVPSDGLPYPVFAFAALLPWTYFSEASRRASVGLVGDAELVSKIYFPRLIIPFAAVITPLIDFAVSFVLLLILMAFHGILPTWKIFAVVPLLGMAMLLALSLGLWFGPVNVRYRDIMQTIPFVLQVWMYATPIVYPLSMVPEKWRTLYSLNPMVGVIEGFRWALLDTGNVEVVAIVISIACIAILLASGLVFFRRMERSFADVI